MTDEFHLTPEALLPEVKYSDAELLAMDHAKNTAKRLGVWALQRDAAAIHEELNDGRLHG